MNCHTPLLKVSSLLAVAVSQHSEVGEKLTKSIGFATGHLCDDAAFH
jgi:hypothetical protein